MSLRALSTIRAPMRSTTPPTNPCPAIPDAQAAIGGAGDARAAFVVGAREEFPLDYKRRTSVAMLPRSGVATGKRSLCSFSSTRTSSVPSS